MDYDIHHVPKVLEVYLKLSEYPILARKIRERMRQELFARGVITPEQFAQEVKAKALLTQEREGLSDPMVQESPEEWAERVRITRDHLTDFYFALNLPHTLFEKIVRSTLRTRKPDEDIILTFNPELAPWHMLFAQAEEYEKLPPDKKAHVQHHLQQIIVVIIRGMISDQLDFVGVAREHFDIFDLKEIYQRRIGRGKIGGKAAGMMLAYKILREDDPDDPLSISEHIAIPDSHFIGADVYYDFLAHNELFRFSDQKYKTREDIESDYPEICQQFMKGQFPDQVLYSLAALVKEMGDSPLIVRSSSLLEDNFGRSFAGKYASFFCPNQSSPTENLKALLKAIRRVYASTLNPDALFYRRQVGLVDYDERMAILIQRVEGSQYERYFFPAVAGVAFSRNPFRWNRRIRREDGFLRIVWGLGTRAVDRVANDYPRMVALSHPKLRPETTAAEIKKYSQHFVDVIDLQENRFGTLPITQVIGSGYPSIELLASMDEGDYIQPIHFLKANLAPQEMVLTFDRLLQEKQFTELLKAILQKLERAYDQPVDVEFTVEILPDHPRFILHLLQCRPLSSQETGPVTYPSQPIPAEDVIFTSAKLVPDGIVPRIEYMVYVDPARYDRTPNYTIKYEIGRVIGRLNKKLEGHRYILIGPGRWGSSNIDLGVQVSYADFYNTSMLVEVAFAGPQGTPEVSYGTHFFQDLVESNIYPLPLYPDENGTVFNRDFFENTPNVLTSFLPDDEPYAPYVKVIDLRTATGGHLLEVVMNAEEEKAIGYLRSYE
ncbi:MAG: PEP/pyruvate-binding domain-containing protein [Chloroflexota bacterium]|nr:PEP/pyruvate-binding domain-containing protein [Chloroflexota bacterium]